MNLSFFDGLIMGVVVSILLFFLVAWVLVKRIATRLFAGWAAKKLRMEVARSLQIQRPVVKGKISEQVFPLLSDKTGDLSDLRFIGDPVDYVYFDGLSSAREGGSKDVSVKFIEVKTGDSKTNKAENLVKDAIDDKKVSWEEVRL